MLDLIWSAEFSDDTSIVQFDDPLTQTKEHAFKEVLDKQDKLQCFYLHNINSVDRDWETPHSKSDPTY